MTHTLRLPYSSAHRRTRTERSQMARSRRTFPMVPAAFATAAFVLASVPAVTRAQNAQTNASASAAANATANAAASLRQVLPADVATQILARITSAQNQNLPADALLQRALKFAARGVAPTAIARSIDEHAERMAKAKEALEHSKKHQATGSEIEAGAEAIREGTTAGTISKLAASVPSGRSLTVPLYVLGSLTARGLASDQALLRVQAKLSARASDDELAALSTDAKGGADHSGDHGIDATGRVHGGVGIGLGGPPASVPGNGGAGVQLPRLPKLPGQDGHGNTGHP